MRLYLVHLRHHIEVGAQVDVMIWIEIRHTDGPQLALLVSLFQGAIGPIAVAVGLVQQHEVEILGLHLAQALVNRSLGLFVTVVRKPYLRDEEQVFAPQAALLPGIAHTFLVLVSLCCVYHSIAHAQRIAYATFTLFGRHLKHSVTHLWHFNAIVQFDSLHIL